jgi:peptidoglycan/LPS O-acetylase OafA/YrhL
VDRRTGIQDAQASGSAEERAGPPPGPAGRMDWLDALRGLAVACVVLAHARIFGILDGHVSATRGAWLVAWLCQPFPKLGVPLFTVISGYLLLTPRPGERLASFYAKRARRILPALFIWHVIYAMLVSGRPFHNPWGLMHLWFLWALIPLYAITPLLRLLARRAPPTLLLVLSFAGLWGTIVAGLYGQHVRQVLAPIPHALLVASVRLLPFYVLGGALRGLGRVRGGTAGALALAGPVVRPARYGLWHAAMASGLVLWMRDREGGAIPFMAAIGRRSFGIYLVHAMFQLWLVQPMWGAGPLPWYALPVETSAVLALSYGTCWAYDVVLGRVKTAFHPRRGPQALA